MAFSISKDGQAFRRGASQPGDGLETVAAEFTVAPLLSHLPDAWLRRWAAHSLTGCPAELCSSVNLRRLSLCWIWGFRLFSGWRGVWIFCSVWWSEMNILKGEEMNHAMAFWAITIFLTGWQITWANKPAVFRLVFGSQAFATPSFSDWKIVFFLFGLTLTLSSCFWSRLFQGHRSLPEPWTQNHLSFVSCQDPNCTNAFFLTLKWAPSPFTLKALTS